MPRLPSQLSSIVMCGSLALTCGAPSMPETRPNLVLIVIDMLRADKLGCYGLDGDSSSELDALARDGVRFSRVVAQSSWTRPSIGSMLTSKYPREIGIYEERGDALPRDAVTLAESLKAEGYATFGATANPHLNHYFNFDQGFDGYVNSDVLWHWMPDDAAESAEERANFKSAEEVFDDLLELASGAPQPVYLQANIMEVHEFKNPRFSADRDSPKSATGEPLLPYSRAVALASNSVGEFIRQLSAMKGWENTIFAITSDHGEGLGDHPDVAMSRAHGSTVYESTVAVPLILWGEGISRGVVVDRPVRLLDLMPTLLELASAAPVPGARGVSLTSLIRGEQPPQKMPEYFVTETYFRDNEKIAVYSNDWKYVENRDGHEGTNPTELHPIGQAENGARTDMSAANPETVRALREFLVAWEAEHPKQLATSVEAMPEAMADQLEALGYVAEE